MSGSVSLGGFPPVEERSRPDGAEEEAPDTNRTSGDDGDDEEVFIKNLCAMSLRRTSKDLNFLCFLPPSLFRQNLDKSINPFQIQIS